MIYSTILIFTREEGLKGVTTSAVLKVSHNKKMTQEQILVALTKALTAYAKTPEGRKIWQESCRDFNIGDLASYEKIIGASIPHQTLTRFGIIDFEILDCGEGRTIPFDRVLIDSTKLPKDWEEK